MIPPEVISVKERLKELRKALDLNQTEFAQRIHMKQTSYSQLETGTSPIRDAHIDLICSAFQVNKKWLVSGDGEMFRAKDSADIDSIVDSFSFPEICGKLLYAFDGLDPDQQEAVLAYARRFISSLVNDDAFQVAAAIAEPSEKDALRQALAQRLTREKSSASPSSDTETA